MKAVTTIRKRWSAAAFGLILLLLLPQLAWAHASYRRSEPGDGAVVAAPPRQVDIWFSQQLFRQEGQYGIEVLGPEDLPVHAGQAIIDDDDRSHMWVGLIDGLTPGEYEVVWWNLSAEDGDSEEGAFTFHFDPAAQVTSTPMPSQTATPVSATTTDSTQGSPAADQTGPASCLPAQLPLLAVLAVAVAGTKRRCQPA